jgi:hypothetical protein
MKKAFLFFGSLVLLIFSSCSKEHKIMRQNSGAWEITRWERITYNNGVVASDTIVDNMGYILMWNNGLNGFNEAHYHFNTFSPPCWSAIANGGTQLDAMDDVCYWESDTYHNDRLTLEYTDGLSAMIAMMFTVTKSHKNKQEWTYITTGNGSASSMDAKDVFTLERTK